MIFVKSFLEILGGEKDSFKTKIDFKGLGGDATDSFSFIAVLLREKCSSLFKDVSIKSEVF